MPARTRRPSTRSRSIDTYTSGDMRARRGHRHDAVRDRDGRDGGRGRRRSARLSPASTTPTSTRCTTSLHQQGAARGLRPRAPKLRLAKRSPAAARSMREGSELVGWGMATGMWDAMFMKTSARARLTADGRARDRDRLVRHRHRHLHRDHAGGGRNARPAADRDHRESWATPSLPTAPVEGGSWGAASTGAAVQLACKAVARSSAQGGGKVEGKPLRRRDARSTCRSHRRAHGCQRRSGPRSVSYADA